MPGGGNTVLDLDTLELTVALEAAEMEGRGGGCGSREGSLSPPGGNRSEVSLRLGRGLLVVEGRAIVAGRVRVVTVMMLEIFSKHQTPRHDINPDLMTKLTTHPGLIMQLKEGPQLK